MRVLRPHCVLPRSHGANQPTDRSARNDGKVSMSRFPLLTALLLAAPAVIEGQQPANAAAPRTSASASASVATPASAERKGLRFPRPRFVRWSNHDASRASRDDGTRSKSSDAARPVSTRRPATAKAKGMDNEPMAVVDRRLRLLVTQQERWYSEHARYGTSVASIARKDNVYNASMDKVDVQVLYASSRGWTAIAAHPDAPGRTCVVFVGFRERLPLIPRTRADAKDAVDEGRPMCDK